MVCQAMSLLSPATLNIPIEVANCEDSEIQSNQLNPIIKQFLQSFSKTSLPNLSQFLLPRRQNILSLFSSGIFSKNSEFIFDTVFQFQVDQYTNILQRINQKRMKYVTAGFQNTLSSNIDHFPPFLYYPAHRIISKNRLIRE